MAKRCKYRFDSSFLLMPFVKGSTRSTIFNQFEKALVVPFDLRGETNLTQFSELQIPMAVQETFCTAAAQHAPPISI